MYETFYHFQEKPFSLTPDPKFLYFSKQHQGALDHMLYGIREREGFMVIVGGIGTGKTTLCRCLLNKLDAAFQVALILNPMLSALDLLRTLVHDLGAEPPAHHPQPVGAPTDPETGGVVLEPTEEDDAPAPNWVNQATKKELLDALNRFLLDQHGQGGSTVVIIDEAQNLDLDVMEQLRLLSNLETEKEKLLQIIFVGQKELDAKLRLPELKQLRQRISIRYELKALSKDETRHYIDHRLVVARGASMVGFAASALNEIFRFSKGYPRLINLVCDRALLAGFNDQVDLIEARHVRQGIRSLLGDEEKSYFWRRFAQERFPLLLSVLFFASGLAFFLAGGQPGWPRLLDAFQAALPQAAPSPTTGPPAAGPPAAGPLTAGPGEGTVVSVLPSGQAEGDYRIQVHSFRTQTEAQEHLRVLRGEGFQAYFKVVRSTGKPWYVVYVGPYRRLEQARIHLKALKFSGRNPILLSINGTG
ncbi:MAG: AAA family ATPase [Nitrospinaceae bacterium]